MRRPGAWLAAMLAALAWSIPAAAGDDAAEYDRISLSASASDQVDNDTLVAVLYEQREGSDPSALADQVNRSIARALDRAKKVPGVDVQTLEYRTTPVYRDGRLTSWRVRQSLRLQSKEADRVSRLVGDLQSELQVQSIGYLISDDRRGAAEERLIAEAIGAFTRRAELVAAELGRPGYRLVSLQIDTRGEPVRPTEMRMLSARAVPDAPPALEPGTREVEVSVQGTVELKPAE